jgi:hypothetical protein
LSVAGRPTLAALAAGAMTIGLAACGGGSDSGTTASGTATNPGAISPTMPQAEVIAKQFPKPKPIENAPVGAMKAIEAGRKACRGKTPTQVRDEFMAAAKESGELNEGQEQMLHELPHFEKQARTSPDFAAGQLAAGVYEATLPERMARSGYQGCVYELALQLRRELTQGGNKSNK